jgi:hypothetical protein
MNLPARGATRRLHCPRDRSAEVLKLQNFYIDLINLT